MNAGLYAHVPFCRRRCAYCDFASSVASSDEPRVDSYLEALRREWEARRPSWGLRGPSPGSRASDDETGPADPGSPDHPRGFSSVYVGGGTPTWIGASRLARLVSWLRDIAGDAMRELTVEGNPDSLDAETASASVDSGATRLSVGVQSLDDRVLERLGRCHTAADAVSAVGAAREAGVGSLSIDVICGGPEETDESWACTVEGVLALGPDHVSVYALTLENGTRLSEAVDEGAVTVPDEDAVATRLDWAARCLERAGLARYEISNWARAGHECLHNLNYWRYGEYLGLGAGAVSRVGDRRVTAPASVDEYLTAVGLGSPGSWEEEPLDRCMRAREAAMLGLRLVEGVTSAELEDIAKACGMPDVTRRAEGWIAQGLLRSHHGRVSLTDRGMALANRVLADLTVP